jgi:hypothetical protein
MARSVDSVYLAFAITAETPMEIRPIGADYPGRMSLRLGDISPDVSISCDNEALARLRDVISAHLDSQAGGR